MVQRIWVLPLHLFHLGFWYQTWFATAFHLPNSFESTENKSFHRHHTHDADNQPQSTLEIALSKWAETKSTVLILSYRGLEGQLPAWLGEHIQLEMVRLNGNQLSGKLQPSMGHLVNLRHLDLSSNQLSGSIPESFGQLVSLEHLDLSYNTFSGRLQGNTWRSLLRLTKLDLSHNHFIGSMPDTFNSFENLIQLNLGFNQFDGLIPDSFGQLVSKKNAGVFHRLEKLDLSNNALSGFIPDSFLEINESLFSVDLCFNNFSGQISGSIGPVKCPSCKAGHYAFNKERCLPCDAGRVAWRSGLDTCLACPSGTVARRSGSSDCDICSAGSFAFDGTECKVCDSGKVASKASSHCHSCGPFSSADIIQETCNFNPLLAFSSMFCIVAVLFCFGFCVFVARKGSMFHLGISSRVTSQVELEQVRSPQ